MTELNLQQKAAAAKGQLGPSSLLAFWNTLSPVTSPATRSQGKDFPTGLPPSRHYPFHRHNPHAVRCTWMYHPSLITQVNTQAFSHKIRWQIQCPKITREKNDTLYDLTVPDSIVSDLPPYPLSSLTVAPDSHTERARWSQVQRVQLGTLDGLADAL